MLSVYSFLVLLIIQLVFPATGLSSAASSLAHRVFVKGLKCDRDELQESLEADYGEVHNTFVLRETSSNPYAFVTFEHNETAQGAIAADAPPSSHDLYQQIKPAQVMNPRIKSAQRKEKSKQEWESCAFVTLNTRREAAMTFFFPI